MSDENIEIQEDNNENALQNIVEEQIEVLPDVSLTATVTPNSQNGNLSYNISSTYSPTIATDVGDINTNVTVGVQDGNVTYNVSAGYENMIETPVGNINVTAQAGVENGSISYEVGSNYSLHEETSSAVVDVNAEVRLQDGIPDYELTAQSEIQTPCNTVTTVALTSNKEDSSITVGVRRPLLNPDNPYGTVDQTQQRKEELVETGDRFSLQSQVGYSAERGGIYTSNSLMYRIDDNNFLNTSYSESATDREIEVGADLEKVKTDLTITSNESDGVVTNTNTLDITTKGKRNQYELNVVHEEIKISNDESGIIPSDRLAFGLGTEINRTEYGEFNSGFNANYSGNLSLRNGTVSGYKVSLDNAYNYYGEEHDGTSDYMVRSQVSFGSENGTRFLETDVSGALRFNNCRTIFEPEASHSITLSPAGRTNSTAWRAGIWQQVGKNFGDATVFVQAGQSFQRTTTAERLRYRETFTELVMGADIKASQRLAFTGKATWDNTNKWGGEVSMRVSF